MTIIQEYHKALDLMCLRYWKDFLESRHYITGNRFNRRCNICGKELRMRYEGSHFSQFKKIKPEEHEKVVKEFYTEIEKVLIRILKKNGYRLLTDDELEDKSTKYDTSMKEIKNWVIRESRLYVRTFNHYFKDITIKLEVD